MRNRNSKCGAAVLLENCLPFHHRVIKPISKSFTAGRDPVYLLDKTAQLLFDLGILTQVITFCHLKFPLWVLSDLALVSAFQSHEGLL